MDTSKMDINKNYINILLTGDRLGGQLTYNFAYLFYSKFYNLPIRYLTKGIFSKNRHTNSIFFKAFDKCMKNHNKNAKKDNRALSKFIYTNNWYQILATTNTD